MPNAIIELRMKSDAPTDLALYSIDAYTLIFLHMNAQYAHARAARGAYPLLDMNQIDVYVDGQLQTAFASIAVQDNRPFPGFMRADLWWKRWFQRTFKTKEPR
jgi:hypothetical protein